MKKYTINVSEHVYGKYLVEAKSIQEAVEIARKRFESGDTAWKDGREGIAEQHVDIGDEEEPDCPHDITQRWDGVCADCGMKISVQTN